MEEFVQTVYNNEYDCTVLLEPDFSRPGVSVVEGRRRWVRRQKQYSKFSI